MAKKYDSYSRMNDVEIASMIMTSDAGGAQSIQEIVKGFSIYEHLDGKFMTMTIDFVDNISFISKFPVIGQETITVKYRTPGWGYPHRTVKFDVMKVGKRSKSSNGSSEYYQLTCVSSDQLPFSTARINYSMRGSTSRNVRRLLRKNGYRKGMYSVDSTKHYSNWVIPNLTLHETLKFLTKRSRGKTTNLSDFFLFETSSGWNCRSLSKLFSGKSMITYRRSQPKLPRIVMNEYSLIQDMQILSYYNRYKEMDNAQHAGKLTTFDWTKKTTSVSFFSSGDSFSERKRTSSNLEENRNLQESNRYDRRYGARVYLRHQSTGLHGIDESTLNSNIEWNESGENLYGDAVYTSPTVMNNFHSHPNDYQTHLLNRRCSTIGYNPTRILIKVSGNSNLNVGDVITLDVPPPSIPTRKNHEIKDKSTSGRYIITNLRQRVDLLQEYQFISYVELARDTSPLTMPDSSKFLGTDKETVRKIEESDTAKNIGLRRT
jgi:hypothetical protein